MSELEQIEPAGERGARLTAEVPTAEIPTVLSKLAPVVDDQPDGERVLPAPRHNRPGSRSSPYQRGKVYDAAANLTYDSLVDWWLANQELSPLPGSVTWLHPCAEQLAPLSFDADVMLADIASDWGIRGGASVPLLDQLVRRFVTSIDSLRPPISEPVLSEWIDPAAPEGGTTSANSQAV